MDDGAELLRLYDIEIRAYYAYQDVSNGNDLPLNKSGQPIGRISPTRVEEARAVWVAALRELKQAEGYSKERIAELLDQRTKEVA